MINNFKNGEKVYTKDGKCLYLKNGLLYENDILSNMPYNELMNGLKNNLFSLYNPKKMTGNEEIIFYVDGSFDTTTQAYSYGVIIVEDNEIKEKFSCAFDEDEYSVHRNVAGEIRGAVKAIQLALNRKYKKIKIFYDYEGIKKWATKEWKANKKLTQMYSSFFSTASKEIEITFEHIKSHSGNIFNDTVDRLAKDALGIK